MFDKNDLTSSPNPFTFSYKKYFKGSQLKRPYTYDFMGYDTLQQLIKFLNQHTEITTLDLEGNQLNDKCAELLTGLTFIRKLNINYNPDITDKGAYLLYEMKNLRTLLFSCHNPGISDDCKQDIRTGLENRRNTADAISFYLFIHGVLDNQSDLSMLKSCFDVLHLILAKLIKLDRRVASTEDKKALYSASTLFAKINTEENNKKIIASKKDLIEDSRPIKNMNSNDNGLRTGTGPASLEDSPLIKNIKSNEGEMKNG